MQMSELLVAIEFLNDAVATSMISLYLFLEVGESLPLDFLAFSETSHRRYKTRAA
jgi:hypothetical protein